MNLLYLCAFVPWPATDGDKIRAMVTLRHLAKVHRIFGFFLTSNRQQRVPEEVRVLCRDVEVVPMGALGKIRGAVQAWIKGGTVHAGAFWSAAAQARLIATLRRWPVSALHVHRLRMMPYAERLDLPYILDATDCLSHYYERAGTLGGWRSLYARLDLPALRRAERHWVNRSVATLAVTGLERRRLQALRVSRPVFVVPNGLNLAYWKRSAAARTSRTLVFLGNMGYPPNVEGLRWFLEKPAVALARAHPGAVLHVIGAGAPGWLVRRAKRCPLPVKFLGYQQDVRPHFRRAAALICSLPVAVGLQNKAIQAMACGLPVVATRNVAAAIGGQHGVHLLAADEPAAVAHAAGRLLQDPGVGRKLAGNARRLVQRRFSEAQAQRALRQAYRVLERAVGRERRTTR